MAVSTLFNEDSIFSFAETWTPGAGLITSSALPGTPALQYVFFSAATAGTVTVEPFGMTTTVVLNVQPGVIYPLAVKRITASTAGAITIYHNGSKA